MSITGGPNIILNDLIAYYSLSDKYFIGGDNLVSNSFDWNDSNDDGLADNWIKSFGNLLTFSIETGQRVIATTGTTNYYDFGVRPVNYIDVTSGLTYNVSGRIKSNQTGTIRCRFGNYSSPNAFDMSVTTEWTDFSGDVICGSLFQSVYPWVCCFIGSGIDRNPGDWFEIDDVVVKETSFVNLIDNETNKGYSTNIPTFSSTNITDYAMTFNGTDDKVVMKTSTYSDPECVNFWFKSSSSSEQIIIGGIFGSHVIQLTSSKIHTSHGNPGTNTLNTFTDGNWHNVNVNEINPALSGFTIYVDGINQELEYTGSYRATSHFAFGQRYYSLAYSIPFDGDLSDIKFYNRILTEEEILQNYDSNKTKY